MDFLRFVSFFLKHKLRRLMGVGKKLSAIELRFCAENKIDTSTIHSGIMFGFFGQFDDAPVVQQIHALVIPKRKRFGNALLQLADAYNIARGLGVYKIYHRGYSFLNDVANVGGITFVKGVPKTEENYLIGDFYQNHALLDVCTDNLDRWEIVHAMAGYMTLSLVTQTDDSLYEPTLYIHLRSGDIFKKTPPHRDYGQPPLAFYTKIIRSQPWGKVHLVFEDQFNPVIAALQRFLSESGIPYETHSGDIHHDVEVLLRAKNLVIARGTFIYPILCISKYIDQVFYFEVDEHSLWGLQNSPIHFHKCTDLGETYRATILMEWKNNAEQNALMLDYPESQINIG
jgi:hypothetical protein